MAFVFAKAYMKKIILAAIIGCSMFACNNSSNESKSDSKKEEITSSKSELDKKVTKRNYSITAANAYNNIFLDSIALEKFIAETNQNDSLTRRMRSFYNARNYQYAWFAPEGLTEQARGFWNLQSYYTGLKKDTSANFKSLTGLMDKLETVEDLKVSTGDKNILNAEFLMTEHFIKYILNNYENGVVKRKELERFIPLQKRDALKIADSLLTKKHKDNKYYEDENAAYKALKEKLAKYYSASTAGGWQPIASGKISLKQGTSSPVVLQIKKRLQATGEMSADSTPVFNAELQTAIMTFQKSLGLTADGIINESLIKEMNVPVVRRIEQILINMDRMRWMPEAAGNLILVNIPEFQLQVFEGKKKAFAMNVVVGKEGHNTQMFKGDLNQIVFSPYWNVTPDIVKEEIMPAMARNPDYLASHNMEITGNNGGIPVVRQLPGEENSLGKVKFLFPNSFNIYFHDTPAKSLFSKDKRAYSHGCIRLSDPPKLAEYLLRSNTSWPSEKIFEAMNSGKETFVSLKNPVPVIITYYTAWVDENGLLNFRDDIYGHDAVLQKRMFTNVL
jgi:L,D-transpeptidase YcbB